MLTHKNERSLIPLLAVSGIVAVPLIFILGMVFGSQIQLSSILTADSLSSWVAAFATVAIAVLTFVLAKETWYLREAQIEQLNELRRESIRPNVAVTLKNSQISFNLMMVEVWNQGRGIARNIKFKFIGTDGVVLKQPQGGVIDEFMKLHIFSEGMHSLGIGQKVESFLFSFFNIKDKVENGDIFSPYFRIEVSCEDVEGTVYCNELTVDFKEFKGITEIGGGDPLHRIAGDVQKLREQFEIITKSSSKRLHVNTYSATDRKQEEADITEWRAAQMANSSKVTANE